MPRTSKKINKDNRKKEAEMRNHEYATLPVLERQKRLDTKPGNSSRERDRLGRLIVQPLPKPDKSAPVEPEVEKKSYKVLRRK